MLTTPEVGSIIEIEGFHFPLAHLTVTECTFTLKFQTVEDFSKFEDLLRERALFSKERFTRYFDAIVHGRGGEKTLLSFCYVCGSLMKELVITCEAFEKVEQ